MTSVNLEITGKRSLPIPPPDRRSAAEPERRSSIALADDDLDQPGRTHQGHGLSGRHIRIGAA
jgi:hypothetical protein